MKRTFRGVVKIQRPLFNTSGNMNELLIYNEDRSVEFTWEVTDEELSALFPNEEFKTYWLAEGKDGGKLNFIKQVEDEAW